MPDTPTPALTLDQQLAALQAQITALSEAGTRGSGSPANSLYSQESLDYQRQLLRLQSDAAASASQRQYEQTQQLSSQASQQRITETENSINAQLNAQLRAMPQLLDAQRQMQQIQIEGERTLQNDRLGTQRELQAGQLASQERIATEDAGVRRYGIDQQQQSEQARIASNERIAQQNDLTQRHATDTQAQTQRYVTDQEGQNRLQSIDAQTRGNVRLQAQQAAENRKTMLLEYSLNRKQGNEDGNSTNEVDDPAAKLKREIGIQ